MVLEDGVIHHPTRLSEGPAWLTAAIYLNVIGSKLARERVVSKEGTKEGRGSPGNFPEASPEPQTWLGGGRQPPEVRCAVRGAEPRRPQWGGAGRPGALGTALGGRWELGQLRVRRPVGGGDRHIPSWLWTWNLEPQSWSSFI